MLNLLPKLLEILARVDIGELTESFVEVYEAATEALDPKDQETAKQALVERRLDNDQGHARLQALLEEAKSR